LTDVIPSIREEKCTDEIAEDYQKFEKLLTLFAWCFRLADLPSAMPIMEPIANLVTASASEWQEMIADEGDTSRLTYWEREIGQP
jgi:hypothetical protein